MRRMPSMLSAKAAAKVAAEVAARVSAARVSAARSSSVPPSSPDESPSVGVALLPRPPVRPGAAGTPFFTGGGTWVAQGLRSTTTVRGMVPAKMPTKVVIALLRMLSTSA